MILGITGLKTDKIHLPREVITLAAAVSTIQTKNIAAGLIVLKFQAKIIGHNVSLTKKYSVILIYFRAMADDRWQSETLLSAEIFFYITSSIFMSLIPIS